MKKTTKRGRTRRGRKPTPGGLVKRSSKFPTKLDEAVTQRAIKDKCPKTHIIMSGTRRELVIRDLLDKFPGIFTSFLASDDEAAQEYVATQRRFRKELLEGLAIEQRTKIFYEEQ